MKPKVMLTVRRDEDDRVIIHDLITDMVIDVSSGVPDSNDPGTTVEMYPYQSGKVASVDLIDYGRSSSVVYVARAR